MKASHSYSWYSKCYTLWYFAAGAVGIVLAVLFIGEAPTVNELLQQLARGAVILSAVMLAQYFITERNAKYWPITIDSGGLTFHAGPSSHKVCWNNIKSIEVFPTSNRMSNIEWSQAMFSSGVIIHTKDASRFVIYKKIRGYQSILDILNKQVSNEST